MLARQDAPTLVCVGVGAAVGLLASSVFVGFVACIVRRVSHILTI